MVLSIVVLFANVKRFGFYIKPSSEYLMGDVSSELYQISFFKERESF